MRTPEDTKAYLKHRTFDAKDLEALRNFVESQPQFGLDAYWFRRPSGDVSPSRPNCDVDTFMRWYYREEAVIDWERREWDLSLTMLNTSISTILRYQLDAKERGLDVDVEKLQNGITEFISEVTNEFVANYKARLAENERGGGYE